VCSNSKLERGMGGEGRGDGSEGKRVTEWIGGGGGEAGKRRVGGGIGRVGEKREGYYGTARKGERRGRRGARKSWEDDEGEVGGKREEGFRRRWRGERG